MVRRPRRKTRFVAFVAASADGRIAVTRSRLPDWTSAEDWHFFQKSLARCDAVIVGRNTFRAAEGRLRKRTTFVLSRRLRRMRKEGSVTFLNPARTDLYDLLSGFRTVAVAGGASVYQYCLDARLMDELYITIEPVVLGRGIPMVMGGTKNRNLILRSVRKLNRNGTLLIHYSVRV